MDAEAERNRLKNAGDAGGLSFSRVGSSPGTPLESEMAEQQALARRAKSLKDKQSLKDKRLKKHADLGVEVFLPRCLRACARACVRMCPARNARVVATARDRVPRARGKGMPFVQQLQQLDDCYVAADIISIDVAAAGPCLPRALASAR